MKFFKSKSIWILITAFIAFAHINLFAGVASGKNHSGVYQVNVIEIAGIKKTKLFSGFIKINQTNPGAAVSLSWARTFNGMVDGNNIRIAHSKIELTLTMAPKDKAIRGKWKNDGKEGILIGKKVDPSLWPESVDINGKMIHINPNPKAGFQWSYLLFIPEHLKGQKEKIPMLVIPNNSGITSDNIDVHQERAENRLRRVISKSARKHFPFTVLMPVFPRFKNKMGGWKYYTHTLDRDTMLNRPEKQVAVTIKWQGELMPKDSKMSYDLNNLFMVQNNIIYRSIAADFNPNNSIAGVSEFNLSFIFETGADLHKPFNLIEFPKQGGFFFQDVALTNQGEIVNSADTHGDELRVVKLALADDQDYPKLWNPQGDQYWIDNKKPIRNLDQQLIAMMNDAKKAVHQRSNIKSVEKVVMFGFSASGMFVDRFSYLHPDLVSAVAIGAPGGLPMTPLAMKNGSPLRYPIGLYDYQELTGGSFDQDAFNKVHRFVFMGENDENDSIVSRDSFEIEDEKLIFQHLGETPVKRFRTVEKIFKEKHLNHSEFKIYPGVGHMLNQNMINDSISFLTQWDRN